MKRNYGIDLLRLVLMFMVVMLHVLGTGGVMWSAPLFSGRYYAAWSLESLCYCAVNAFALITGFVHYNSRYKVSSLLNLAAQAFFYSASITLLSAVLEPGSVSADGFVNAVFPIHRVSWWYVSAYGGLFLLIPVLEAAAKAFTERQAFLFLIATYVSFSLVPTFLAADPFMMYYGYSTLWLAWLYLIGAFIKKFDWSARFSAGRMGLVFLACAGVTALSKFAIDRITLLLFGQSQFSTILLSNTSPTVVAASIALLMTFARLDLNARVTALVKKLSPAAFGVYLIHCHPLIFAKLAGRFVFVLERPALVMTAQVLLIGLAIYLPCLLIDCLRIALFRRLRVRERLERLEQRLLTKI